MKGMSLEDLMKTRVQIGYGRSASGDQVPISLSLRALCSHTMVVADTGGGKGVLQRWLLSELAKAGVGWTSYWPLSKDPTELLAGLPADRRDQVVWAPLNDPDYVLPLNFLHREDPNDPEEAAFIEREAVNLYYTLWSESWSQNMAALLRAATRACILLLWNPAKLVAIFLSADTRQEAIDGLRGRPTESNLRAADILGRLDKMADNAVWGPVNRLLELLDDPFLADALNAPGCWDCGRAIRENLHTIVYTAGDKLGPLPSRLAAAILIPRAWRAAQRIEPGQRVFHLTSIDEAGYAAGRVATTLRQIIEQGRQYQFGVLAACQHPGQFPQELQETSSIVGNWVVGRQKAEHAMRAVTVMGDGPQAPSRSDYTALRDNSYYTRILKPGGEPTRPFWMRAAGYVEPQGDFNQISRASMARYLLPRKQAKRAVPKVSGAELD